MFHVQGACLSLYIFSHYSEYYIFIRFVLSAGCHVRWDVFHNRYIDPYGVSIIFLLNNESDC